MCDRAIFRRMGAAAIEFRLLRREPAKREGFCPENAPSIAGKRFRLPQSDVGGPEHRPYFSSCRSARFSYYRPLCARFRSLLEAECRWSIPESRAGRLAAKDAIIEPVVYRNCFRQARLPSVSSRDTWNTRTD